MCEASAFILEGDNPKLIMEAVDTVEPEEDGVRLVNIFGEQNGIPFKFKRTWIFTI